MRRIHEQSEPVLFVFWSQVVRLLARQVARHFEFLLQNFLQPFLYIYVRVRIFAKVLKICLFVALFIPSHKKVQKWDYTEFLKRKEFHTITLSIEIINKIIQYTHIFQRVTFINIYEVGKYYTGVKLPKGKFSRGKYWQTCCRN